MFFLFVSKEFIKFLYLAASEGEKSYIYEIKEIKIIVCAESEKH